MGKGGSGMKQSYYRGCLLGLAVGDAMGYTVDGQSWQEIVTNYGPNGLLGYDLVNGYADSALYSFVAFFIMAAVCGFLSHTGGEKGENVKRNIPAAIAGALTYFVIYSARTIFLKGMIEKGLPFDGALIAASTSMITSFINVIIAVVLSNIIALPVIKALRRTGLLSRMEG